MAIISVTSLTAPTPVDETIQKLSDALKACNVPARFVVGTQIQEPNVIQVTAEWTDVQSPSDLEASPAFTSFKTILSSSSITTLASLDKSPFAKGAPPLLEYVKTDFPTASLTPARKAEIEADFARFEEIYRKRGDAKSTGEGTLAIGWSLEHDVVLEGGKEEKVTSFFVARGWEGMKYFEKAVQSEEFKEAIPILMGWGAPFTLWHVERKVVGGGL